MAILPSLNAPEGINFEEAIALTQSLLSEMEQGTLSESEIEVAIASLVKTMNGARGFFVTYLTDERSLADHPSPAVIEALKSAPEIVSELLVKNVAMSAAMVVHHRRNQNEEMAASSLRVRSRTTHLIQRLQLPVCQDLAKQVLDSALTGEGAFQAFLQRWGYDQEQKQAIGEALEPLSH